jgi:predicted MPP superfamily phosphohydrolase
VDKLADRPDAHGVSASRIPDREAWFERRKSMEAGKEKHTPRAIEQRRHWVAFRQILALFGVVLRISGLYRRGVRNAREVRLKRLDLAFQDLPPEFDGFRILQLSDLHVDFLPETLDAVLQLVAGERFDFCVLTGDYRKRVSGPFAHILPDFERLLAQVEARMPAGGGACAILGNHDCADMVPAFEKMGFEVLVNQTRSIQRGGAQIHFTGTDDVHYYYTEAARAALETAPAGFKIALIHSAELADVAEESGFHLYLAGHTHGGQVCLPGGRPIITHMSRYRAYASGLWRHGDMVGYTTTGVGVSGLPVRFNTRGEAVLITLNRKTNN